MNLHKTHATGIVFWSEDQQHNLWVLIGRRKSEPFKECWSVPLFIEKNLPDRERQVDGALAAARADLGLEPDRGSLTFLTDLRFLFCTFHIYASKVQDQELPPAHNNFHMVMWAKATDLPKPSCLVTRPLLARLERQCRR